MRSVIHIPLDYRVTFPYSSWKNPVFVAGTLTLNGCALNWSATRRLLFLRCLGKHGNDNCLSDKIKDCSSKNSLKIDAKDWNFLSTRLLAIRWRKMKGVCTCSCKIHSSIEVTFLARFETRDCVHFDSPFFGTQTEIALYKCRLLLNLVSSSPKLLVTNPIEERRSVIFFHHTKYQEQSFSRKLWLSPCQTAIFLLEDRKSHQIRSLEQQTWNVIYQLVSGSYFIHWNFP